MDLLLAFIVLIYSLTTLLLLPYPLNYLYLAIKSRKWRDIQPKSYYKTLNDLPEITIHIPVYNEPLIIESTLNNILSLDYPTEKLKVFIIDDSDDSTTQKISEFIDKHSNKQLRHSHMDNYSMPNLTYLQRIDVRPGRPWACPWNRKCK